jgi:glucosyl-3-phosphoglycerate synthase
MFTKVLVPVTQGSGRQAECQSALAVAAAIAGEGQVILMGLVYIPEGEPLSAGSGQAREVRKTLQSLPVRPHDRIVQSVRVTHRPWDEIRQLVEREAADLLVLEWPAHIEQPDLPIQDLLETPPCDLVLASGPIPECPESILVALRGGPYAELALRLALAISQSTQAEISALHTLPIGADRQQDAPFRGIEQVLENLPQVQSEVAHTEDAPGLVLQRSRGHALVILGATGRPAGAPDTLGPFAHKVLQDSQAGVLVVKTRRPLPRNLDSETAGQTAISVLVDQWFAENTYSAEEFEDLDHLLRLKQRQGLTISLALPALNEEETVGTVIDTVKSSLMDSVPLLDEIVLIDSDSTDRTREIAAGLGVPVYIHQQLLPSHGPRRGKGEALWKSLLVTRGDILLWIDTDIVNIHPRFVYGLLGPLLQQPEIQFVKGFYRRPIKVGDKVQAGGGGRVTELTARPLLNLFYPELSGIIQPLSGEYGGRRSALEQLPFFSGYGVEIGLLIDMFEQHGLQGLAQVDLQERIHHNQSLQSLSKMSFAIIQAVIQKLERRYGGSLLKEINKTMKLIHYEPGHFFLEVEEIAERERPPMVLLKEYREMVNL